MSLAFGKNGLKTSDCLFENVKQFIVIGNIAINVGILMWLLCIKGANVYRDEVMKKSNRYIPFTQSEINQLLCLNQRLSKLERHLLNEGNRLEPPLQMRMADPNDPMNDYEIEAKLYYILRKTDSAFNDDDDNYLTMRYIDLKGCAKNNSRFCDGEDWREILPSTDQLDQAPHCWLFHDLYDHDYGENMKALSLRDCLRIGSIWVVISVEHQADLVIDNGEWLPATADN